MSSVKQKRTRREANLEATRAHVVASAGRCFLATGYARTTLADVAREAGVAVQTLYNVVGGKQALLLAVFEAGVSGAEAPRSAPVFLAERTAAEPDPAGVVGVLADWFVDVHARMGPLWRVLDEAAGLDPEIGALVTRLAHRRLANYGLAADAIAERGGSRGPLDRDGAAALIWSVGHPSVHRTLVGEQGWSPERYRQWVRTALAAALVDG